jgi:hypothetical protein
MAELTGSGLMTVLGAIRHAQAMVDEKDYGLKDILAADARLIISPSNRCERYCTHCIASSTKYGRVMDFSDFSKIPMEFFQSFNHADFGRRGDPYTYSHSGHGLADLIGLLADAGIKDFSIAAAVQQKPSVISEQLADLASKKEIEGRVSG